MLKPTDKPNNKLNTKINKNEFLKHVVSELEKEYHLLKQAALASHGDATHEENKPENKYDTRALEASYIAGAQSKRVIELGQLLNVCRSMKAKEFKETDPVAIEALVQIANLEIDPPKVQNLFLVPLGGGFSVTFCDYKIQLVSISSPMGKAILGKSVGHDFQIQNGNQNKTYEIISIN